MNITKRCISLESEYKLFGYKISANVIVPVVKIPRKINNRELYNIADFSKHHGSVAVYHGGDEASAVLDSLVDKKILVNSINAIGYASDMLNRITVDSCLSLFDSITLELDLSKANDVSIIPGLNNIIRVNVANIGNKYIIGKHVISKLNEQSVMSCLTRNMKTYNDAAKSDTAYGYVIFPGDKFLHEIVSDIDSINNTTMNRYVTLQRNALHIFRDGVIDTSGSLAKKGDILRYLHIGSGYVPIDSHTIKSLSDGRYPSNLYYRDAAGKVDKLTQPINLGTSGKIFNNKNNKNGVVMGYTDDYIDSVISEYYKRE